MATALTIGGKYTLFKNGWTTQIDTIKLYTQSNVLVDTQSVTFAYNAGDQSIRPTANIVFNVASGTEDVAYVEIGDTGGGGIFASFYSKDLPALYDFATAGTLTLTAFTLTLAGSYIQTAGKSALWQTGWESLITWSKLYTQSDALVDSQSTSFTANISTGAFECNADIIFDVAGGTNSVAYSTLGYTDGSDVVLYKRIFSSTYNFTTAGTLTVDSWSITI